MRPRRPIIVIPSRLAATRRPNKPLLEIHGVPMIVQCWRRALEADIGPVVIACADAPIADAVTAAGGEAILTDPGHASGSDRVYEAVARLDPDSGHDAVINLQGDLPTIGPQSIRAAVAALDEPAADIGTIAAVIVETAERGDPSVVKAAAGFGPGQRVAWALYFSRAPIPSGAGDLYHHIGLYAYRRAALERFVHLPPGVLEQREGLEQLRALEAGMRIGLALVDTVPVGVDTPADLALARELLAGGGQRETPTGSQAK